MKVGIFGTGAYGLALASILTDNNAEITMWTKFEEEKKDLERTRSNEKLLPGFILDKSVKLTTSIEECAKDKELLIIAIPVAFINDLCINLKDYVPSNMVICIASKGIEQNTGLFIHEIVKKYINNDNISVLSGPSFAKDIVTKNPIGLSIATKTELSKDTITKALSTDFIKFDYTDDIIGVEICSAIKNVLAIAAGILDGINVTDSTKAMFLTRCLSEIKTLIKHFGGGEDTILTFAGIGDLILTCNSTNSRNNQFGRMLGNDTSKEEIKTYLENTTVEGYYTLESIYQLLLDKQINNTLIELIRNIINGKEDKNKLLEYLVCKV